MTAAKFEPASTRCRNNLKTVGNLTARNLLQYFDGKEMYALRIDQSRPESIAKMFRYNFFSSVHMMPFSKCAS